MPAGVNMHRAQLLPPKLGSTAAAAEFQLSSMNEERGPEVRDECKTELKGSIARDHKPRDLWIYE